MIALSPCSAEWSKLGKTKMIEPTVEENNFLVNHEMLIDFMVRSYKTSYPLLFCATVDVDGDGTIVDE